MHDFKKAYDTINRDRMWTKLDNIGISGKSCTAIRALYTNVLCSVRVNGYFTDWFDVNSGLKQDIFYHPCCLIYILMI